MSRLGRWMTGRVLATSVVSGLLGVVLAAAAQRRANESALQAGLAERFQSARSACEAAPERWREGLEGGLQLDAYDGLSLRSRNPSAPPLEPEVIAGLGSEPGATFRRRGAGSLIAYRGAREGTCGVLVVRWPGRFMFSRQAGAMALSVLASAIFSVAIALLILVFPLAQRIRRLSDIAGQIAIERPSGIPLIVPRDELEGVALALRDAGEQLYRDKVQLEERAVAIERHLDEVAHDLRTPLSTLQLSLEQALEASSLDEVHAPLSQALRDCIYLDGLTANLRMATRLQQGWDPTLTGARIDLCACVENVMARSALLANVRRVDLGHATPDEPLWTLGDPIAIERILANLIENAILHNVPQGHVAVQLSGGDEGFLITIEDDGPLVRAEDAPALADPMARREPSRNRGAGGHGLGLTIVHELASRMGWAVDLSPREPHGLRVSLRSPR